MRFYSLEFSGLHCCLFVKVLLVFSFRRNSVILACALCTVKTFFDIFQLYLRLLSATKLTITLYSYLVNGFFCIYFNAFFYSSAIAIVPSEAFIERATSVMLFAFSSGTSHAKTNCSVVPLGIVPI